jgi:hypothetical protein
LRIILKQTKSDTANESKTGETLMSMGAERREALAEQKNATKNAFQSDWEQQQMLAKSMESISVALGSQAATNQLLMSVFLQTLQGQNAGFPAPGSKEASAALGIDLLITLSLQGCMHLVCSCKERLLVSLLLLRPRLHRLLFSHSMPRCSPTLTFLQVFRRRWAVLHLLRFLRTRVRRRRTPRQVTWSRSCSV